MQLPLVILTAIVVLVLAANLRVGSDSRFSSKWDEYDKRQAAKVRQDLAQPLPVTKRYLVTWMLAALVIAVIFIAWGVHDGESLLRAALVPVLLYSTALLRLYKEYRKPGHGSRRQRAEYDPSEDW